VGTSEAATHGTPLAVCHAANLVLATVHYCAANTFVMRGTMQKMPRMCEVISGLYCMFGQLKSPSKGFEIRLTILNVFPSWSLLNNR